MRSPSSRTVRTAAALAGAAILVTGASACSLFDRDPGERVLIVGDSVTYQSRAELKEEFAWADELDIKATSGLRTDELLPGAEEGISNDPSSAVFMPGYNDILQGKVPEAAVPEMMDLAAEVECSVWLLIPVEGVYSRTDAEAFNQRVRDEAEDHDNVHLVDDWARLVDNSQDFALVKREDAVHPNDLGRRVVAQAMGESLKRECDG
jgi:hypothetical protein